MGVTRHHILSRKQGISTAEMWVSDGKARPPGWYVNLYFKVPGALLMAQPFLSVELVPLQHYPECCLPPKRGNRGVWGQPWSGAYRKPGHEDHVSLLWESGGNGRRQLPALASLQPSGVTQLSWPMCVVLSWQRKS